MTDKELLELAARAAGIKARYFEEYWPGLKVFGEPRPWNPLSDDADAFRLAVKLKMEVAIWNSDTTVQTDEVDIVEEKHNGDPYAATRRAITRAAAAIGEERGGND